MGNRWTLPREHGFWVMLSAALAVGIAQAPGPAALGGAAALAAAAILGAGLVHKRIRAYGALQTASAAMLGLLVAPVARAGGGHGDAAAIALAAIFLSGALVVRVAFARARRRAQAVVGYSVAAIVVCASVAGLLVLLGELRACLAAAIGVIGTTAMLAGQPTPKKLKALGLGLAIMVIAASGVLML